MASITLAATLNTPKSELRPATIDRILVIEHDRALQKILQRLFSSEGYEVDVVQVAWLAWRCFAKDPHP
jgi:DNA-binding NtrC family response regulator